MASAAPSSSSAPDPAAKAPKAVVLQLVAAAKSEVQALRAADEALLKTLAGVGKSPPSLVAQQVAACLTKADAALASCTAHYAALTAVLEASHTSQHGKVDSSPGLSAAIAVSTALGRLQQSASKLAEERSSEATVPNHVAKRAKHTSSGAEASDRAADLRAIQEVVDRVALISGKRVVLRRLRFDGSTCPADRAAQGTEEGTHAAVDAASATDSFQIRLEIEGVACFVLSLGLPGSLEALRLAAFSDEERCEGRCEPWGASEHTFYRHLSAVAMRAVTFFRNRGEEAAGGALSAAHPEGLPAEKAGQVQTQMSEAEAIAGARLCRAAGIEDLLLWLASFEDLFCRNCEVSKCLLATEPVDGGLLPPLLRPFRQLRPALLSAARPGGNRRAYHLYAAPLHQL